MAPLGAPGMAQIALGLGDFVGVVGKGVVDAAAVQVQILAVVLHGDAGALNVPAGIAHAPRGVPFQGLILELGLGEPQHKVVPVALVGVLLHALTDAHRQILLVVIVEDVVPLQLGGVEVHVAAGHIGIALLQQAGDDLDIVIDEAGSGLHHVGALDVQLLAVGEKRIGVVLGDLHNGLMLAPSALEHLILALVGVGGQVSHIGDVHDAVHVIAHVAQVLLQYVLHDVGAQVADVGKVVHRGAAGVHLHMAGGVGLEFLFLMGGGIIQIHDDPPMIYIIIVCAESRTPPMPAGMRGE